MFEANTETRDIGIQRLVTSA